MSHPLPNQNGMLQSLPRSCPQPRVSETSLAGKKDAGCCPQLSMCLGTDLVPSVETSQSTSGQMLTDPFPYRPCPQTGKEAGAKGSSVSWL